MANSNGKWSGARFLLYGGMVASAASFISGVLLAHLLGPEDRGVVAAVFSLFMLLRYICSFGAIETATAAQGWVGYSYGFVLKHVLLWSVFGLFVVIPIAWVASPFFLGDISNLAHLLVITLVLLPFAVLSDVVKGALLAKREMLAVALHTVSLRLTRLVGVIVLLIAGLHTVTGAVFVSLVGAVIGLIIVFIASARIDKRFGFTRTALVDRVSAMRIHKFSVRLAPGLIARIANRRLDQILMLGLAGSRELGFYAVAVAVAEIPDILTRVFRQKTLADQTANPDPERIKNTLRLSVLIFLGIALPIAIFSPLVVPLLFGERFQPAVFPLCILLLAGLFNVIREVAGVAFLVGGRPGVESFVHIAGLVLGITALYVLAPKYGAIGAAIAALCSYSIVALLLVLDLARKGSYKVRELIIPTSEEIKVLVKYVEKFVLKS